MKLSDLKLPFEENELEWRVMQAGFKANGEAWAKVLCYMDARAAMDRLDNTVGPENWKDRYWRDGASIMCGLSIKVDGEWIEKVDGSEETDVEAIKGGLSGSFKRACVKWGIGRYLYDLKDDFAKTVQKGTKGAIRGVTRDKKEFYWIPPQLPKWALPLKEEKKGEYFEPDIEPDIIPPPPPQDNRLVTRGQVVRLFTIMGSKKISKDAVKTFIEREFGITSTSELTMEQYDLLVNKIDNEEL